MSDAKLHTPIFDSWPLPSDEKEGARRLMPIKIGGPFPRWGTLSIIGAIGAVLIIFPHLLIPDSWRVATEISDGFGIALLTSAFLAFTIERWLRGDLAKDIFLTAIGHHLPESYREALKFELMRLASYPFLCERHLMIIKIEPMDGNESVRVTTAIERTFRNVTGSSQPINAFTHIDEWCFAGERSKIHECQIERIGPNGNVVESIGFDEVKRHDNMSISAASKEIRVGPRGQAKAKSKTTEIKRRIDELSFVFMRPTIDPSIQLDVPDGFEARRSFGPDEGTEHSEEYVNRRTWKGMYWPLQRMRIHWWPTEVRNQLPPT
jgi:hypothetical protein